MEEMRSKTSKGIQSKIAEDHCSFRPFTPPNSIPFNPSPLPSTWPTFHLYFQAQTEAQCNSPLSLSFFSFLFFQAPAHLPFLPPPLLFCSNPAVCSFPMQLLLQKMSSTPRKLPIEASTRHANPYSTTSHMEPCCYPCCCMIQPSSFGYKRPRQRTRKGLANLGGH